MKKKIIKYGILTYAIVSSTLLVLHSNKPQHTKYDSIIILGNSPNPNGKPNPFLKMRLETGIKYLNQGYSKKLILTGAKIESYLSEAEIFKTHLEHAYI